MEIEQEAQRPDTGGRMAERAGPFPSFVRAEKPLDDRGIAEGSGYEVGTVIEEMRAGVEAADGGWLMADGKSKDKAKIKQPGSLKRRACFLCSQNLDFFCYNDYYIRNKSIVDVPPSLNEFFKQHNDIIESHIKF